MYVSLHLRNVLFKEIKKKLILVKIVLEMGGENGVQPK